MKKDIKKSGNELAGFTVVLTTPEISFFVSIE